MSEGREHILSAVQNDLDAIEAALSHNLNPYLNEISQTAGHLLFSGGKRLRPLLLVLSARICGYDGSYDKTFSIIFEYLHAATLLHDDMIDDAEFRRGKPVAHLKWGNPMAVLVGDFLFARALSIAAETKKLKIIKILASITEDMSQGEIHQLLVKGKIDLSQTEYFEVIRRKTAVLIQGACQSGAIIANASKIKEKALSSYGLNLGMAFQIVDDLLDYTADTRILGKTTGVDLKEGKLTLPVIYALERANPKDKSWMIGLIKNQAYRENDFEKLIELLENYGGLEYAGKIASEYINKSKEALSAFESSNTRELLLDIADYTLTRNL